MPAPTCRRTSRGAHTGHGLAVPDTDWHVDRLYGFLNELDVTVLTATHSRIVVDLNRSPAGGKLYPGQAETGICPTESFAGEPLLPRRTAGWGGGRAPRCRILATLPRQRCRSRSAGCAAHGKCRLLDGHSIHGSIPRLFPGNLPDLNLGTFDGASATAALTARVADGGRPAAVSAPS